MQQPDLSVVVVTAAGFSNIRRTIAHLRRQSIVSRIEMLIVAEKRSCVDHAQHEELAGFFDVKIIESEWATRNVDKAAAYAVPHARAEFIALIEDHAYPEPKWAELIVAAHRSDDWAAVGPLMVNANPRSMISWTNLLIAYGPWTEDEVPGERETLPGHNLCYRKSVLDQYGDQLVNKLGRNAGLLEDLQEQGRRFYLSPARLAHANPSRIMPCVQLRFNAGRLYGWTRATTNCWTPLHRFLYTFGGPLIPFLRFSRLKAELFGGGKRAHLAPHVWPALFLGLVLDGAGQIAGYAFGPGKSIDILAVFEMDRMQHLTASDKKMLMSEPVDDTSNPMHLSRQSGLHARTRN